MKFKPFQLRWRESLGRPECPYLYRWVFNFGLFSIRVHHWLRSDDKRYFHNHPWAFISIVLKGGYTDVSVPLPGQWKTPILATISTHNGSMVNSDKLKAGSIRYRPSNHRHYVDVPKGGCWSLLLCGPQIRKWGFWVNDKFYRPLRFFSRHGHPPCHEQ
jgi:hypothetical protein